MSESGSAPPPEGRPSIDRDPTLRELYGSMTREEIEAYVAGSVVEQRRRPMHFLPLPLERRNRAVIRLKPILKKVDPTTLTSPETPPATASQQEEKE